MDRSQSFCKHFDILIVSSVVGVFITNIDAILYQSLFLRFCVPPRLHTLLFDLLLQEKIYIAGLAGSNCGTDTQSQGDHKGVKNDLFNVFLLQ